MWLASAINDEACGVVMGRVYSTIVLLAVSMGVSAIRSHAQDVAPSPQSTASPDPTGATHSNPSSASAGDAPRMSRQTRLEIIRDFETQLVYSRTAFPMGGKGLRLQDGTVTPNGQDLQQLLALWGPAIRPGDPTHISFIQIKDDHIHLELNGGAVPRKKWYQHIQISGANGTPVPLSKDESPANPRGSYLDIYFDKYVPEMSASQLRSLLLPVLDFNARSKEEAYLDTVPPKVKAAIEAHHVLVGMNTEMVVHAVGKAPRKVREKDGDTEYEEWIYGEAPQDVEFVRIVGDEVVRIETMKIGGQKIVRTEKEVVLDNAEKNAKAKKQEEPAPNAPSLRRPGEDSEDVPKPSNGASPVPPTAPDTPPSINPGPGVEMHAVGEPHHE